MPIRRAADEIVDAEVITDAPPRNNVINLNEVALPGQGYGPPSTYLEQGQSQDMVLIEKRARAISLFIKVPFLAYIALNSKLPGIVRLGAGALAFWEASQIARDRAQIEELIPEQMAFSGWRR